MENLNEEDKDFIIFALNQTCNDENTQLQGKSLGDLERVNFEFAKAKSKEIMTKLGV